jgi:hypothetical protein
MRPQFILSIFNLALSLLFFVFVAIVARKIKKMDNSKNEQNL